MAKTKFNVLFLVLLPLYSCDKKDSDAPPKALAANSETNAGLVVERCPVPELYIAKTAYPDFIDVGLCTLIMPMIPCNVWINSELEGTGLDLGRRLKVDEPIGLQTSSKDGVFYLDDRCTQPITTASIGPKSRNQYFYKDSKAGKVTLTISDKGDLGLSTRSQVFTMTPITALVFTPPTLNQKTYDCGNLSLEARKVTETAQSQSSPLKIRLWSSSKTGVFYSDKECILPITSEAVAEGLLKLAPNLEYSLVLAAGQSNIPNIYYRDSTPGSHKLTAISTESASASVTMKVTISP